MLSKFDKKVHVTWVKVFRIETEFCFEKKDLLLYLHNKI